ncbi:MAG: phosphotransferase [Pseudomonadota bacterium]|nr:phosphotransferase [Pseudomonadota bacterium]
MTAPAELRRQDRAAFLAAAGWAGAETRAVIGDASTRSYERLAMDGRTALLMNAPPAAESAACPPGADAAERRRLGYNALARLAGPNMHAFLEVDAALRAAGLSAPEVYAADAAKGFALIEDLGDALFAKAIPAGADERTLYAAAIDALLALRAANPPAPKTPQYAMLSYDRLAMEAEVALVTEWYWPFRKDKPPPSSVEADYFAAWAGVLDSLSAPATMVLRDYHAENLLWLPQRQGHARVGVIDFQDGLIGCAAYDLVSLLEDARRDVDPTLAEEMIARYCGGAADSFDETAFRRDYAILAAQRNAKILGIFARLIRRDNKPRYHDFLPRVETHFRRDLGRPALAPVKTFFQRHFPELTP